MDGTIRYRPVNATGMLFSIAYPMHTVCRSILFFRASDISEAFSIMNIIFSKSIFSFPEVHPQIMLILLTFLIILEWIQREKQHALEEVLKTTPRVIRWIFYYILIFIIILWFT